MVLFRGAQHAAVVTGERRRLLAGVLLGLASGVLGVAAPALAHDFTVGDIVIDHPYATPTPPGARTAAAWFRGIRNRGKQPDRLIAASTPIAERVELHRTSMRDGVARMREVEAIEIPASATVQLRHGQGTHLMLVGLRKPLAQGDSFELTLKFERAGERTVRVDVMQPKDSAAGHSH